MTKFSMFFWMPGFPSWEHWGWFDTRREARDEAGRHKEFCPQIRTRVVQTMQDSDFSAIANSFGRPSAARAGVQS
jgi:hypothetical protein